MTPDAASTLAAMAQDWRIVIDARSETMGSAAGLFGAAAAIFGDWSTGPGFASPGGTLPDFDELVARGRRDWADADPAPIMVSDDAAAPSMLAVVEPADLFARTVDRVWIRPAPGDGNRSSEDLRRLFTALAAIDGLINVHVRHELLAAIFYARAATEKASAATPADLRAYLPPALIPDWGLGDPGLVLPDGGEDGALLEAIWNANLFGAAQVDLVGRDVLWAADWYLAEQLPSGAVLALATAAPPQSMDARIAAHILGIIDRIGLPARQRAVASSGKDRP
ncbi:MAG: hypothetical protein JNL35_16175 [Sphingopyxis sp.]|nr:hypothetical protein [Sphingopyxis sp.]